MEKFYYFIHISKILLGIAFIIIIFVFINKYKQYQDYSEDKEKLEETNVIENQEETIELEIVEENQEELEEELRRLERIQELKEKLRKNKE